MPSADSLAFDKPSMRSSVYISYRSRVNVELWETLALTSVKEETCPLSTTPCFRFLKNLNNKFKK